MKLVTVKEIKENDIILDREGLELVVKKIETCNKKYFVTVNYKESGFYKVVDTTKKCQVIAEKTFTFSFNGKILKKKFA